MHTLYFTRHGKTEWNELRKVCGISESSLSATGKLQAQEAAEYIKSNGIKIDQILCSPLQRAKETAQIISDSLNITFKTEELLMERNCGIFEGTNYDSPEMRASQKQVALRYGGESVLQTVHRIYTLLDELTNQKNADKIYLLVGHNGISKAVHSYFCEMTTEEFLSWRIKNCQIVKYEF